MSITAQHTGNWSNIFGGTLCRRRLGPGPTKKYTSTKILNCLLKLYNSDTLPHQGKSNKVQIMQYRRALLPGACYFFTLTLEDRRSDLLIRKINELRQAFNQAKQRYPFIIDGVVVMPDHCHLLMTLPPDDRNYSQRVGFVKSSFSRQIESIEVLNNSRKSKRERGIWQRRFWEHVIRDELDYSHHLDYIHYNPVKHGYVKSPNEWQYSSIHRYIKLNMLPNNWCSNHDFSNQKFGE